MGRIAPGVTVLGESLVDVVTGGGDVVRTPGGSPFNVARALGRLGVPTELFTQLGRDADGDVLRAELAAAGVQVHAQDARTTSRALATIDDEGAASYEFDIDWSLLPGRARPRSVLHTGSIAAFLEPGSVAVRDAVRRRGRALVSFDPNIRPAILRDADRAREVVDWFAGNADVLKLSDEDAAWLWPGESEQRVQARLLDRGVGAVALTRGARGSSIATRQVTVEVPATPTRVVDTIGAGDAWMAGLIAAIVHRSAFDAIRLGTADERLLLELGCVASVAAGLTVAHAGARTPLREELDGALGTAAPGTAHAGSAAAR